MNFEGISDDALEAEYRRRQKIKEDEYSREWARKRQEAEDKQWAKFFKAHDMEDTEENREWVQDCAFFYSELY